jgi:alcohol dehydrogenase (NADP+)
LQENAMKALRFRNGDMIPTIGLGTWKSQPGEVGSAVEAALKAGYRHIDCAAIYRNEAEIGEALERVFKRGEIQREDVHITSKLWNNAHRPEDVIPALQKTLRDLRLDYLDLYLIHWPVAFRSGLEGFPQSESDFLTPEEAPVDETWAAMLEARSAGMIRHAGVSNFSTKKLDALARANDERPEMNQVELHPYLQQPALLDYCRKHDILMTAYSPLGSPDRSDEMKQANEPSLLDEPAIQDIAKDHDAHPAQVLIAWAVARETAVIPKSINPDHIRSNLESAELELTDTELERIESLDRHYRYIPSDAFRAESGLYGNIFDD